MVCYVSDHSIMMKKALQITGLGLLILIIVALLLAPGMSRRYVVKNSPELIGRAASIDQLRVFYLTGKIRITGFTLFEEDRHQPFIAFDTLVADLRPLKVIGRELNLQHFYLSGLSGVVVHQDSLFNFSDLLAFHSTESPEEISAGDSTGKKAFRYHLYDIALRHANFV